MSTDLHGRSTRSMPDPDEDSHRTTGPRTTPQPDQPPKAGLSAAQVVGGALAAMTAAALGSRLSVAGTVVGAALASVIAAVGGSLYTTSLRRTHQRMTSVWESRRRPASPEPDAGASTDDTTGDDTRIDDTSESPTTAGATSSPPAVPGDPSADAPARGRLGWRPVLAGAAAIFVIAAAALTGFELLTGHALSGGTGTTVSQVTEPRSSVPADRSPAPASPTASETQSSEPTTKPSSSPTTDPSASTAPTPVETPTPTATPSGSATGSPGPDEPSVGSNP